MFRQKIKTIMTTASSGFVVVLFLCIFLCLNRISEVHGAQLQYNNSVDRNFPMTMSFPKNFLFGVATASYQVEGGWNADGKGENIWDRLVHSRPELIRNESNGDVACDSYHKYKEDVALIKELGFQVYRFSISWARILPDGEITKINKAGVDYYHALIDELLKNGIKPMVTMYHWDLPQRLQDMGGWLNPLILDYTEDYADLLFQLYGEKVKLWITINEPLSIISGYTGLGGAPALNLDSPANYIVGYNLLRAHGRIYKLYDSKFRPVQQGKITICLDSSWFKEKTSSKEDIEARDRALAFSFEFFAHPIYSKEGDFPDLVKMIVAENSKQEGRTRSRLPKFTNEEIDLIRGSWDFFSLNHYSTWLASPSIENKTLVDKDRNVKLEADSSWPRSHATWQNVVPWGFLEILLFIKNTYDNPPVYITENGYCSKPGLLDDAKRINYFRSYLQELVKARENHGCNVIGYTAWSILDNFEWMDGFENRFGIVDVDFKDPNRKRTLKKSAYFFKLLLATRIIPNSDESF